MRLLKLIIFLLLLVQLQIWSSDAELFKNEYNDEALKELMEKKQWEDPSEEQDIAFWLFWVLKEKRASQDEIEYAAFQAIEIIEKNITKDSGSAKDYYRLATLYKGLIVDASSWMKYAKKEEEYLDLSLSKDPHYKDTLISLAGKLLFFPPNAGGDENRGWVELEKLNQQYPDDIDILMVFADYYLEKNENEKAKGFLSRILIQNPNHFRANEIYGRFLLFEKKLVIGQISLIGQTKTRMSRELESIEEWTGEIYNSDSSQGILNTIKSIPSITDAEIETREQDDNTVDILLHVSENNTKIFGLIGTMGFSTFHDSSPDIDGYPVFLYIDQNIFGTANNLMIAFSGIYLAVDYTIKERFLLPFNLILHWDGRFYPKDISFIENGMATDWNIKTPIYNASVKMEKNFSLVNISLMNNFQFNDYTGGTSDFSCPKNNLTYRGDLQLGLTTTTQSGLPGPFSPPEGSSISFTPSVVYKPDYKSWGSDTDLNIHNDLPGFLFKSDMEYYMYPSKQFYLGGSLHHYGGLNVYESEKWKIGQIDLFSSSPRLSGYLSEEFSTENGFIANLDSQVRLIPGKFIIFAKHDLFFDLDVRSFKQGSAVGCAVRLPYEIELISEAGIGWNAERENGPGWSVQIALARYFTKRN